MQLKYTDLNDNLLRVKNTFVIDNNSFKHCVFFRRTNDIDPCKLITSRFLCKTNKIKNEKTAKYQFGQ